MPDRVLIVGAGPTGLTAALELSLLGIPARIIDKQSAPATPCVSPSRQHHSREALSQGAVSSATPVNSTS
jgi:2-polyprenyl-6-methoxyphenol hydroxylase-like FAD-dependent oxidoreductase